MYTLGVQGLFALAVALVNKLVGFLGYILFQEVSIVGDHGFKFVVEHDGSGVEIAVRLPYPLSGPDGTDDVRMPVFARITVDKDLRTCCKSLFAVRSAILCDKNIRVGLRSF